MRTRAVLGSIFASVTVLVLGWQAGSVLLEPAAPPISTSLPGGGVQSPGTTTSAGTNTEAAPTTTTLPSGTFTGGAVATRFGDVQVEVAVSEGTITDVTPLQLTDTDGKSVQISNYAAPLLRDMVLAAQSANVSNVSGATYTTGAYLSSLQSALDQAGL